MYYSSSVARSRRAGHRRSADGRNDHANCSAWIAAHRGHPRRGPDGRRLGRLGELRAQRPARRGRRHPPPHPGRRGATRLPRQPAGPGAAPGPHHDLRLRGAQLRQPVLPRGALRRRGGRGRGGRDPARAGLPLLAGTGAPAPAGDGRAAAGRAGHRPGRDRRVDPALAATCAPGPRWWRSTPRRPGITGVSPGPPGQRRRGRAAAAPPRRAGAHLGGVPDRAAPPDGGRGPAAPLPAAEPARSGCGPPCCTRR